MSAMSIDKFIEAINAAKTWVAARAIVAQYDARFANLSAASKNRCRRAWRDRQAALALIGEVKSGPEMEE